VESLEAYQVTNARKGVVVIKTNSNDLIWKAPKNDFVKVNWNAIMDKNSMKMGVGVIARDGMREVLVTLSLPRNHIIELDIV
jgi:hypothetical protein